MTFSSTLKLTFGIITAVGTLIAAVMHGSAPNDKDEPSRVAATSSDARLLQTPVSAPYQGSGEDARGQGFDDREPLRREVDRLRGDFAAIKRHPNRLTRYVDEAERPDTAQVSAVLAGTLNIPFSEGLAAEMQELEAEFDQRIQAQVETNEAALQKEITDTAWSVEVLASVTDTVSSEELAATSIQDVECRATLCRVEVTHKDLEARSAFERQFFAAIAQVLPQAMLQTVENGDGSINTVMYLLRDCHDFPKLGTNE